MRPYAVFAAAALAVALSGPARAATDRTADSQGWKDWQTMQDREACHALNMEFREAVAHSHDSKAVGHADSIAGNAATDCNTGHYRAGREAFAEALAALGVAPVPSWGDAGN